MSMLLTVFLTIVFCAAITLMMFSAVAFIQNEKFFSSAPKEAQAVFRHRDKELFYGARIIGWNIKSQLIKLFVIFPAASALAAWICALF